MSGKRVQHAQGRLARLAARQHGVVTLAQLYSLGFSDSQVRTRAAAGWLHRLHRGVFAVGRRDLTLHGRWMAAVLACGDGAVLSHQAAGELWNIRRRRDEAPKIEITIPRRRGGRPRPGLTIHRLPTLRTSETTTRDGIPVTSPARTVLDLACRLPRRQLERAMDEAERLNLCTEDGLNEIVRAHFGRPGAGALGALLRDHRAGSTATRNDFEERFLALCRNRHLPSRK
jgi:predicted transcriptional regulator of viral defense system